MASDNLTVCDEEFLTVKYKVEKLGEELSEANAYYCKILQYILDEAIESKSISSGFAGILEQIKPLADSMADFYTSLSGDLESYISEIDEADSFLY